MTFLARTIIAIVIISLAAFAVASAILLQEMDTRLSRVENTTAQRLNNASAQLAGQSVLISEIRDQLSMTREQLSLETLSLREEFAAETASLKAADEGLRSTAENLESSITEETQARIDTSENLSSQISSIQVNGAVVDLDFDRLLAAVVLVACEVSPGNFSQGSGTIIDSTGRLVTNAHVVDPNEDLGSNNERLCVIGMTNSELDPPVYKYTADIVSIDRESDMSFLTISGGVNGHTLPNRFTYLAYPTCATKQPQLNDDLFTIGYPAIGQSTFTVTNGIISGFLDEHIKTSAKIDQGNSGGAAINALGEFIGIPTYGVVGELDSLGYVIDLRRRACAS
jgi:S1-C subfamily serine protease